MIELIICLLIATVGVAAAGAVLMVGGYALSEWIMYGELADDCRRLFERIRKRSWE